MLVSLCVFLFFILPFGGRFVNWALGGTITPLRKLLANSLAILNTITDGLFIFTTFYTNPIVSTSSMVVLILSIFQSIVLFFRYYRKSVGIRKMPKLMSIILLVLFGGNTERVISAKYLLSLKPSRHKPGRNRIHLQNPSPVVNLSLHQIAYSKR